MSTRSLFYLFLYIVLVLPGSETLLRCTYYFKVAFYEIMKGMWVRNGLQIRGQAMTYIQCHFSNSMVDPDLFLLQICATRLNPDEFLRTILDRFNVQHWLSLAKDEDKEHLQFVDQAKFYIPSFEDFLILIGTVKLIF